MEGYLLIKRNYFFDPHGTDDFGGRSAEVVDSLPENVKEVGVEYIPKYTVSKWLSKDEYEDYVLEEGVDDDTLLPFSTYHGSAQDGYNLEINTVEYIKLNGDDIEEVKDIVNNYNKLIKRYAPYY